MQNPNTYYFELPAKDKPPFVPLREEVHDSYGWLTKNRSRSRGRDVFEVIDTIVVHATAGWATEHAVDAFKEYGSSAHWIIPDEDEPQHGEFVWATVAEAKSANHTKDKIVPSKIINGISKKPNFDDRSLGIEIVNTQDVQSYSDPFSKWQIEMTANIILYAWAKYPNLKHIISHAKIDPANRADPGKQFPWEDLKEMVLTHSTLGTRDPLVSVAYTPPLPDPNHPGCCFVG